MQSKGIVMSIANQVAVVMTADCQFRKIPLLEGMTIGQEVEFPADVLIGMPSKTSKTAWYAKPWRKTGLVAASVLLAVGLWGGQSFLGETPAYAYVTVDINPSVELSIGKKQQVLLATALNEEAQVVLQDIQLKGLPIHEAVESLAQAAQQKGFFQDTTEVIISTSAAVDDEKLKQGNVDLVKLEDDLVSKVKTVAVQEHPGVEVEGVLVSKDVRAAAQQAGVSPGKYALYLNATSNGIDVDLDEIKTNPIHKVVDKKPEMATVVHEMRGGEQLDALLKTLKEEGKTSLLKNSKQNQGILPSAESKQADDNKKATPGGAKKDDDKKQDDKKVQPSNQKATTTKPTDREQSNSSKQQSNTGSGQKSDDSHHSNQSDKKAPTNQGKNNNRDDGNKYKNDSNKSDRRDNNDDDKRGHYDIQIRLPGLH